ncbi:MAG: SdrD B-like domain-containing protein, partial [Cyanobacteria bacterium P01_H01_bin.35]
MTNLSQISNLLPTQVTVTGSVQPNLSAGGPGVGDPSYFDLEITDANGILDGSFDAFCIDTDLPLAFSAFDLDNDGVYGEEDIEAPTLSEALGLPLNTTYDEGNSEAFSASVYSSYDPAVLSDGLGGIIENPENLDLVNWILNNTGAGNDLEGFTTGEIQLALWQLMDDGDPSSQDLLGLEAFSNGFDQANVDAIKALAEANGEGFEPHEPGDKVAIILVPDNDGDGVPDGQIIVTAVELSQFPEPETASLGDKVFFDDDKDGIQDEGEAGVEGVTVTLTGGGADGIIGEGGD